MPLIIVNNVVSKINHIALGWPGALEQVLGVDLPMAETEIGETLPCAKSSTGHYAMVSPIAVMSLELDSAKDCLQS